MNNVDKRALEEYKQKLKLIRDGAGTIPFMSNDEKRAIIQKAKKDPGYFCTEFFGHYATSKPGWFHIRLAKACLKNKRIRRLVRWGRGLAKSVWCDVIIPMWLWVNEEEIFLVLIGNNEDKAKILLGDIQAEFEANPKIIHFFGTQFNRGSWEAGDFTTKDGRFIGKALGMGQSPLGLRRGAKRPNFVVCDDLEDKDTSRNPTRQDEIVKWIENDVLPLMDGDVMRFLYPNNDPWARSIQNQLEKLHPNWYLDLVEAYNEETFKPAWPEKYSGTYYSEWEIDIGSIAARAQFNHKHHTKGKIFTDDDIQWGKPPRLNQFRIVVGFWDVAFSGKNDYNAVKVWGLLGRDFWQMKAFVRQCKMIEAIRFMYEYEETLPKTVIVHWKVESQFWNDPVKDALKVAESEFKRTLNIVTVDKPSGHKYDRILTMHPYYQNGRIYYNEVEYANNDMKVGIEQLKGIEPNYRTHDDSPDADEQALREISKYIRSDAFEPRITTASEMHSNSKNRF